MEQFACLTAEEKAELQSILERYLPEVEREHAACDLEDREFRQFLKKRLAFMEDMIKRLKEAQA